MHYQKLFTISLFFHVLAAVFSEGYHRLDEHFKILEFIRIKMEGPPVEHLSWEYPVKIRPWLQPGIYYIYHGFLRFIGVDNPFIHAMIFRLISSLAGFISLILLAKWSRPFFKQERYHLLAVACLCLLWFLPFFHARTSAENFGMTFFIYGLYFLQRHHLIAGVMLGFSFIFRFQMGVMIAPLMVWMIAKERKSKTLLSIGGIFLSFLIGTGIDFWGYGEWTLSFWNYFYENIVMDKASFFGVSPWYDYIRLVFFRGLFPVGLFLIVPFFWLWVKRPTHILSIVSCPFFFIHSLIPHKELRFIFCLGVLAPVVFALFMESISLFKHRCWRLLIWFSLAVNFTALIISSVKPASSTMSFYRHLYHKKEPVQRITSLFHLLIPRFYLKHPVELIRWETMNDLKNKMNSPLRTKWYLMNRYDQHLFFKNLSQCQLDYSSWPEWTIEFLLKWRIKTKIWYVYRCT